MSEDKKESEGLSVLQTVFAVLFLAAVGAVVYFYYKNSEANEERIKAQNEVARLSEIVTEKDNLVSRLSIESLSQEEINRVLEQNNKELFDLISERDEKIALLTETIIKFRPTRIVITNPENINQNNEGERVRVSFDQTEDPVRVSGFTLTNPAEADLEVSFVRPMQLRTTVTQLENGSWRTYFESDWPVEIQSLQTTVNPLPTSIISGDNKWLIGGYLGLNVVPFSSQVNVNALYKLGDFYLGPGLGFFLSGEDSGVNIGLAAQYLL